jgi:hypothetical protein
MDDDAFVPLSSPVGSLMAKIRAQAALKDADVLRETARVSGNEHLHKHAAKRLLDFEKHAEESQYFA